MTGDLYDIVRYPRSDSIMTREPPTVGTVLSIWMSDLGATQSMKYLAVINVSDKSRPSLTTSRDEQSV